MKTLIIIISLVFISCKKEDAKEALKAVVEDNPSKDIGEQEKAPQKQRLAVFSDIVGEFKSTCQTSEGYDYQYRMKAEIIGDGIKQVTIFKDEYSTGTTQCDVNDLVGTYQAIVNDLLETEDGIEKTGIFFSYANKVADSRLVCGESMNSPDHTYFPVMEACLDEMWLNINNSRFLDIYDGYEVYGIEMVKL